MVISTLRDGIPVFSSNFVSFFSILFSSSVSSCTFVFVHNRRRRNLSYRKLGFQPNEIPGNGKRYGNRVNRILFYNYGKNTKGGRLTGEKEIEILNCIKNYREGRREKEISRVYGKIRNNRILRFVYFLHSTIYLSTLI